MKFKKRPYNKPSWANQNNLAVHKSRGLKPKAAALRVKQNNKIARILRKFGWTFCEGCNITTGFDDYYSLSFKKRVPNTPLPVKGEKYMNAVHPWVHFNFHWDNQGGEDFMVGEMYSFYNYSRHKPYMRPTAQFEIKYITEKHLPLLPHMHRGVVAAINSQIPSYGDSDAIE